MKTKVLEYKHTVGIRVTNAQALVSFRKAVKVEAKFCNWKPGYKVEIVKDVMRGIKKELTFAVYAETMEVIYV